MNKLGIIGGTGLYAMPELEVTQALAVETAYGAPSSSLICGRLEGCDVVFVARHGEDHRLPPHRINYRANLKALQQQGVSHIVAVNAVGGIHPELAAGSLVLPHQLIDYTSGREHTFFDGPDDDMLHVDFTEPYDPQLRALLHDGLVTRKERFRPSGVHAIKQGPRLETEAEVNRLARDGCDIVGMTGMPEAALARELGIPYACLALVVNPAAGRGREPIGMAEIRVVLAEGMPRVRGILVEVCRALGS